MSRWNITRSSVRGVALCVGLSVADISLSGAADGLTVTLLGTGTPVPVADRFGAAILVEAGGQPLLFDCGRGAAIRLQQARAPAPEVTAVFLTHLHSDHVVGLPDLWLTGWVLGRRQPLRVWGPEGTPQMTAHLSTAYEADRQIRKGMAESLPSEGSRMLGRAFSRAWCTKRVPCASPRFSSTTAT